MKTDIIAGHEIEYWFKEDEEREMDEIDIEHVQSLLIQGYREGELCQLDHESDKGVYGWWRKTYR